MESTAATEQTTATVTEATATAVAEATATAVGVETATESTEAGYATTTTSAVAAPNGEATADVQHGEAVQPTPATGDEAAAHAEQQRHAAELAEQQRQQAEWDALTPEQQQLRRQQAEEHQAAVLEQQRQQQAELAEQQRQQAEWDALTPEQQQLRRQQWEEHQRQLLEHQRQQQLAQLTQEQQQQLLAQERQQQLAVQQHEAYQQQLAQHHQQQQLALHQQHLAAQQHQERLQQQQMASRIKRSDVRPVAGQDEELTRLNRFRFLNRTFASTAELKASCKEFGLSILRSDHDRVRLKLRGNTRTLLATFRLQKKSNPQQWRLSQDMSAEAVLHAWTTGNVNPDAVKLPQKRKSDDDELEDCKRNITALHQQSPPLFQKVKEHVNNIFQSTGHSSSVVPTHLPMMHANGDVATAAAVQAHTLAQQQQQQQQYQQHLAAQHHHQMQLAAAHAHDPRAVALAEEQHRAAQLQAQHHAWNVANAQRGYNVNI